MKHVKLFEDFSYPKILYHGTNNVFRDFNSDKPIFFVDNIDVAKTYGNNIIQASLQINNPIIFDFEHNSTVFFYGKYYLPSVLASFLKSISEEMKKFMSIDEDLKEEMEYHEFNALYGDLDGVIMNNIKDSYDAFMDKTPSATNFVVFDKNQIEILRLGHEIRY